MDWLKILNNIQSGAEETHVFHIRITLLVLKIRHFDYTKKEVF
jgi:hypothetical protein